LAKHPDNTDGLKLISREAGAPAVDLASLTLALTVLDSVSEEVARRLQVLPLRVDRGHLFLAMADPNGAAAIDEIAFLSGKKVVAYAAHHDHLRLVIDEAYGAKRRGEAVWRGPKAVRQNQAEATPISTGPLEEAIASAASFQEALRVPTDVQRATPAMREPFAGEPSYVARQPEDPGRRTRPRILIVDDEPVILKILQQALLSRGWEIVTATSGKEALQRVQAVELDAILLDAMLPDVHGFDICKRLKASARYQHIPIIMMTAIYKGWRVAADLKESYGVTTTLEKPFDLQVVAKHLEMALAGRKAGPTPEALSAEARRLYKEGSAAYQRNDLDTALSALTAAVAIDPLSATLRHQLGLLYAQRGQDFLAIQELEIAVDLEPERYQTLRNLAVMYQRRGFRRKSCELWERALACAPDEPTAQEIKGLLLQLL
jgi:DNA-binding response OmpR family regulator